MARGKHECYMIKQLVRIFPIIILIMPNTGQHLPRPSCTSFDRPMNAHTFRFLALGDSYTIGESVSEDERWPAQLIRLLHHGRLDIGEPAIIAKTGWTTDELNEAIDRENPHGAFDIVSLLIGVNNQYRGRSAQEYRREFSGLLQHSIGFAGGTASHVIVLSIPDWGVTPFADGKDRTRISTEIDSFNRVNREEATRAGAKYVDVTPVSRKALNDPSLIASDGLHPSGRMYAEWARLVLPLATMILTPGRQFNE